MFDFLNILTNTVQTIILYKQIYLLYHIDKIHFILDIYLLKEKFHISIYYLVC